MTRTPLSRLRNLCLALPEAREGGLLADAWKMSSPKRLVATHASRLGLE